VNLLTEIKAGRGLTRVQKLAASLQTIFYMDEMGLQTPWWNPCTGFVRPFLLSDKDPKRDRLGMRCFLLEAPAVLCTDAHALPSDD